MKVRLEGAREETRDKVRSDDSSRRREPPLSQPISLVPSGRMKVKSNPLPLLTQLQPTHPERQGPGDHPPPVPVSGMGKATGVDLSIS